MSYFPFFVDVEKLHGVIVGGGNVALEKVERLIPFNAKLTLVAPEIDEAIRQFGDRIELIEREYRSTDLDNADYVIAATDIHGLNEQVRGDAKKRGLLINVVDVTDSCDFIFPSVIKRGKLVVGVSSSGAGPRVAIRLRKEIEKMLPDDIEDILDFLAQERIRAKEEIEDPVERKKYLIELADRVLDHEQCTESESKN